MDLLNSNLFTPWTDPESGVTSYILSKKVAPVQEAFYFVNDSMSGDGRYLWFYCAFPPSGTAAQGRTLGVLDFQTGEVRHFPETQFNHASPYVDPATGWIYWGMGDSLWRRGPQPNECAERVGFIPADLIGSRHIERFATHLTRSADGKEFFVDAGFGLQFVFGTITIETGEYQFWQRFDRNYNHAQFSPTDPDLIVFSQENHPDQVTGQTFRIENRMWLLRRGEAPRPVFETPTVVTHEWWDRDGQHVWCIKGKQGTWRVNIATQAVEDLAWPKGAWHSHIHTSGQYVIGDTNMRFYRGCPSTVRFLNRETGQDVRLVDNPEMPGLVGERYHIDPHPRFCGTEDFVVFTTTVRGEVDVALTPVADLIERTSG
ncbi:MAG: oligogalacturonate lyase family protein [Anaerolineae bacterium]|nr:oligogalacturonate lyase family protein [Anaerolineae bacterium]